MSKRILGLGIIAVGALLLSVALIIGLEFPSYVRRKNILDMCIADKLHTKYETWVTDGYKDKFHRVYYWTINNTSDFIYGGQFPRVVLKGPYVYQEESRKIDVTFSRTTVSFKDWKRQLYRDDLTRVECGASCHEHQNITILNTNFLRLVGHWKGDENLALTLLPTVLIASINTITSLTNGTHDTDNTFRLLGSLSVSGLDNLSSNLQYPEGFSDFAFGDWIRRNDTIHKTLILEHRKNKSFSVAEMKGLYSVLTSKVLLGVTENQLLNKTFLYECNKPRPPEGISGNEPKESSTASYENDSFTTTFSQSNETNFTSDSQYCDKKCGFIFFLRKFIIPSPAYDNYTFNFFEEFSRYLCQNETYSCFILPVKDDIFNAYILSIYQYVTDHLTKYVLYKAVIAKNQDLVTTRTQRDLTLGYYLSSNEDIAQLGSTYIQGVLPHYDTVGNLRRYSTPETLLTCLGSGKESTMGKILAFNDQSSTDENDFPGASKQERTFLSFLDNVPPMPQLYACGVYQVLEKSYDFFWPAFMRKISFLYQNQVSCKGYLLSKMLIDAGQFQIGNAFMCGNDLQNMTWHNGYLSWMSLPCFLHSSGSHFQTFGFKPDEKKHTSLVQIDPITGLVWHRSLQYQMNVGIREKDLQIKRSKSLNISYYEAPIPVFWINSSDTINQDGVDDFQDRVINMLQTSCGGLIGLSVLACPILITGLLVALLSRRGHNVTPVEHIALY